MGCASSVEQQHAPAARTSPAAYKQERGGSRTKAEREDASLQRSSANKPNGLPRSSSKQGSKVKRNQVAPEPIAEPEHSAAADTKTAPDQQQHRASATGSLLGSVAAQSLVETGLTSWNSRQCALKQSWQPFIQELQDLGTKLQGDRAKLTEASAKMQQLLRRAPEWLDTALASPPTDAACMLQACSNAACQLANCVLQPIVLHAERSLTHGEASSSGSLPRGPRWDTLDVDQLISALQAGCESEYGVDLAMAAEPAKLAAELLVLMQQRCARQPHLHARVSSCVVSRELWGSGGL